MSTVCKGRSAASVGKKDCNFLLTSSQAEVIFLLEVSLHVIRLDEE